MFWIYFMLTVMFAYGSYTLLGLAFDFYLKFFGVKVIANVDTYQIFDLSNYNVKNGEQFNLNITYSFQLDDKTYTSNRINFCQDLLRTNRASIEQTLDIESNQIQIYVLKSRPQISMSHPLGINKPILIISLFIGVLLPTLITYLVVNKISIFDVLLG